jgi:hypothetical protein
MIHSRRFLSDGCESILFLGRVTPLGKWRVTAAVLPLALIARIKKSKKCQMNIMGEMRKFRAPFGVAKTTNWCNTETVNPKNKKRNSETFTRTPGFRAPNINFAHINTNTASPI